MGAREGGTPYVPPNHPVNSARPSPKPTPARRFRPTRPSWRIGVRKKQRGSPGRRRTGTVVAILDVIRGINVEMKEFLARPGFLGTYGTIGADLSFILAVLFTILLLIGWNVARKHHGNAHHFIILWATLTMLGYFTFYYLIRSLGVLAIEGREGFGGPDWFYTYVFSPVLTAHILFVSIGLVMTVYMIILGFRASRKKRGKRILVGGGLKLNKWKYYMALSSTLAVLGLSAVMRCETLRCASVYGAGMMLVVFVFFLERIIERLLPKGRRRHILLGRFTMIVVLIVLFTTTLTYLSLYVLFQPRLT